MGSMFDINTINPKSDQILAVWKANKTAYDATNPKYPYPTPPPALYGVWRFAGVDGMPRRAHYTDFTTGAPRIGFAYRLNDKTVVRGGFGTFYQSDTANNNTQTGFSQTTGYTSSFNVNGSPFPSACFNDLNGYSGGGCQSGPPTGPYSLVNPFPKGMTTAAGPADGLLANLGQGSTSTPLHYKTPRTYQYSLGIQRQLPHEHAARCLLRGQLGDVRSRHPEPRLPPKRRGIRRTADGHERSHVLHSQRAQSVRSASCPPR